MSAAARPAHDFWRRAPGARPRIVGHRGARGDAPENTLGAFEHAVALGATAVELDVRACASGELVVLHDPTLERVTAGRDARRAADLPWAELRRVRLAGGERVPLLREVLEAMRRRGVGVNVEMKHDVPDRAAVVRATAKELGAHDPAHPIVVSSFDPRMLFALAREAPAVPRALLVHPSSYRAAMLALAQLTARPSLASIGVDAVHLERTITTAARVRALRRSGLWMSVWTVNDRAEAERFVELGVDSVITDTPGDLA